MSGENVFASFSNYTGYMQVLDRLRAVTDAGITYASCSSQAFTFVTSVSVIRRSSSMVIYCVQIAKFELLCPPASGLWPGRVA